MSIMTSITILLLIIIITIIMIMRTCTMRWCLMVLDGQRRVAGVQAVGELLC